MPDLLRTLQDFIGIPHEVWTGWLILALGASPIVLGYVVVIRWIRAPRRPAPRRRAHGAPQAAVGGLRVPDEEDLFPRMRDRHASEMADCLAFHSANGRFDVYSAVCVSEFMVADPFCLGVRRVYRMPSGDHFLFGWPAGEFGSLQRVSEADALEAMNESPGAGWTKTL